MSSRDSSSTGPEERRAGWSLTAAVILALSVGLAWANSFGNGFVFDDAGSIVGNPTIRRLWPPGPVLSPPSDMGWTVGGRPLVNLSLAVNYAISGTRVWSYHLGNVTIHFAAALLLYGIVRRTWARGRFAGGPGRREVRPEPAALAIAAVWALHPLQTAAVTYLVQRAESLMGLCALLTLYCFIRGVDSDRGRRWYAGAVVACLCGMACKETMVVVPLIVWLYDYTFVARDRGELWCRRGLYLALALTWLLLAYLVYGMSGSRGGSAGFGVASVPWDDYATTQVHAICLYLRLVFWPRPLVFDYGVVLLRGVSAVWLELLLLGALLAGTILALRRRSSPGFLGAWFFLLLAPASSVVPVATQTIAEHRMYLPLAAVVTLAVGGTLRRLGRPGFWLVAVVAPILAGLTAGRNADYRDELRLWGDTVAKRPDNPRAHSNLGAAWLARGDREAAIRCFQAAIAIQPDYFSPYYNLGLALLDSGRAAEAVPYFEAALRLKPGFTDARTNLGVAEARTGRAARAVPHFQAAVQQQPDDAGAHCNLANALVQAGDPAAAEPHLQRALQLNPEYTAAHFALGNLYWRTQRFEAAVAEYRAALRLDAGLTAARNNLANILVLLGRTDEAVAEYEAVLAQRPDDPQVRENLAIARTLRRGSR